jgi:hypothetical protein
MLRKVPTHPASNSKSASPSSGTGEAQARQPNQAATSAQKALSPRPSGGRSFLQNTGSAAETDIPSASKAGPQVHARVCGPMTTARTKAATKKMDETMGME